MLVWNVSIPKFSQPRALYGNCSKILCFSVSENPKHVNQNHGLLCVVTVGEEGTDGFWRPVDRQVKVVRVIRTDGPRMTLIESDVHLEYCMVTAH